jgi:glycosyltransferase involved in cell wall biosynthesis
MVQDAVSTRLNVAFAYIDRDVWRGGYNYLLNLFAAIDVIPETPLTPHLYVGTHVNDAELEPFRKISCVIIIRSPLFEATRVKRKFVATLLLGRDLEIYKLLASDSIDLVFENARYFFGWRFPIPVVAWLPDFQHRHLPAMYGRFTWLKREIGYQVQIRSRSAVLLSSEDAKQDCERFYPVSRGCIAVVHFATKVAPELFNQLSDTVAEQYGLNLGQYFFFPGQLYKHKNHALVIRALGLMKKNGHCVHVAFSGEKDSLRSHGLYEELRQLAEQEGVLSYVHFLGNIPFNDLLGLMRHAIAVMNPSLFEGWSTVVEEARSMGLSMLLSDLPVHMEQMGDQARYFDRYSPEALATGLLAFSDVSVDDRTVPKDDASCAANERVCKYGMEFYQFACRVLKRKL